MQRVLALILAGLTGCATSTASSGGMVVTDIAIINDTLMLKRCDLGMNVEENVAADTAIAALSILAILGGGGGGGGGGSSKSAKLSVTDCTVKTGGKL